MPVKDLPIRLRFGSNVARACDCTIAVAGSSIRNSYVCCKAPCSSTSGCDLCCVDGSISAAVGIGNFMRTDSWIYHRQASVLHVHSRAQCGPACPSLFSYVRTSAVQCRRSVKLLQVLVGKIHKNQHERAVVFWSWLVGCTTGVSASLPWAP